MRNGRLGMKHSIYGRIRDLGGRGNIAYGPPRPGSRMGIPRSAGGTAVTHQPDMPPRRVMLVDDHRCGWRPSGGDLEDDGFEIVAVARSGEECMARARAARPEVVVMDLQIPAPDGATCTELLMKEFPQMRILVISASGGERTDVLRAVKAGARGYLLKSAAPPEELVEGGPPDRARGRPCSPPPAWPGWSSASSAGWSAPPRPTTTPARR